MNEENQNWLQLQTDGFGFNTKLTDSDGFEIGGIKSLTLSPIDGRSIPTITGEFYLDYDSNKTHADYLELRRKFSLLSILTDGTPFKCEVYSPSGRQLRGVCEVEIYPIGRDKDAIAKIKFELDLRKLNERWQKLEKDAAVA